MYSHSKKMRDLHKAKEYTSVLKNSETKDKLQKPAFIFNKATPTLMLMNNDLMPKFDPPQESF